MNEYKQVLEKYAVFQGRSRRREYWMFTLFNFIISIILTIIDRMLGLRIIDTVYALALLVPSIAVTVRRLHDTDRSAWWILLDFIPVIGWIIIIVFLASDGQPSDNRFGPNPKMSVPEPSQQ